MTGSAPRLVCAAMMGAALLGPSLVSANEKEATASDGSGAPRQKRLRVPVRVVDASGGRVFIEPGGDEGLRPGDTVVLEGKKYEIAAVSASFAAVDVESAQVAVGTSGVASGLTQREPEVVRPLRRPAKLATFRRDWAPARLPASKQDPKPVPLGRVRAASPNRMAVSLGAFGSVPLDDAGGGFVRAGARARLHYETLTAVPWTFNLDAGAQLFWPGSLGQRPGADSRPPVRVRELTVGYGAETRPRGTLGRLRYASSLVGNMDGVRIETPIVGDLRVSAFGGTVPNPLNGSPTLDAGRAGLEFEWNQASSDWRPRAVVGAHASRFDGAFDERKMYALLDLLPSFGRFGAHAEANYFGADNPWAAPTFAVTAAGADAAFDVGVFSLGGRFEMRQPDRSRWLASFLPIEWLCVTTVPAGDTCAAGKTAYWTTVDAGLRFDKASVSLGGQTTFTDGVVAQNTGGFANVRLLDLIGKLRTDAGVMFAQGSLIRTTAVTLGPGLSLLRDLMDVSLRYRLASTRYRANDSSFLEHTVGASLWAAPAPAFDLSLDGDTILGPDVNAFVFQTNMTWRPTL